MLDEKKSDASFLSVHSIRLTIEHQRQ